MRNPLETEETAFRFVLGTIAYLAPIVVASWIATWLGVVVFAIATGVVIALLRRGTKSPPLPPSSTRAVVEDTRRILVIAAETVGSPRLRDVILRLADGVAEDVLVVLPDDDGDDGGDAAASEQLQAALTGLTDAGVNARGEVVDLDPLAALIEALERFAPDEIVISTGAAAGGSSPAARTVDPTLVDAARIRFAGPVTHVSADDGTVAAS